MCLARVMEPMRSVAERIRATVHSSAIIFIRRCPLVGNLITVSLAPLAINLAKHDGPSVRCGRHFGRVRALTNSLGCVKWCARVTPV